MSEEWKSVPGFEEYEVSNLGRVRRVFANHRRLRRTGFNSDGYASISLCRDGKYTHTSVHTLVALAFIGERPLGHQVNHIDGNKQNNRVENLEYVTPSENRLHSFRIGLAKPTRGGKSVRSKLSDEQASEVRRLYWAGGITQAALAKKFGVSNAAICFIVNNITYCST